MDKYAQITGSFHGALNGLIIRWAEKNSHKIRPQGVAYGKVYYIELDLHKKRIVFCVKTAVCEVV